MIIIHDNTFIVKKMGYRGKREQGMYILVFIGTVQYATVKGTGKLLIYDSFVNV